MKRLRTDFLSRSEALGRFSSSEETRCDVWCLSSSVVASIGDGFLLFDELEAMVREGLITIRLEEVPCAPMGPRTPPIRHVKLTEAGCQARDSAPSQDDSEDR